VALVSRNVVLLVDAPAVPAADIHPLSPDEAAALLAAAKGRTYEHLFALLLTTGLRLGEALALRWKPNVNLDDARTHQSALHARVAATAALATV
jgi:integrase